MVSRAATFGPGMQVNLRHPSLPSDLQPPFYNEDHSLPVPSIKPSTTVTMTLPWLLLNTMLELAACQVLKFSPLVYSCRGLFGIRC